MNLTKEQVQMALSELDKALAQVDTILAPVLAKPLSDTVKGMAPLDSAKLQVTLAYTMNTLFYLYMRMQNANLVGHEIVKDMDRLKQYMNKIREAEARLEKSGGADPSLKLDKAAAKRFVQSALSAPVNVEKNARPSDAEEGESEEDGEGEESSGSEE